MPTPNEKKAVVFLALVALSGSAVRLWRASVPHASPIESAGLERQLSRVDSVRNARHTPQSSRRGGSPLVIQSPPPAHDSARGPIDLDAASAAEIEALPGVGDALAKRIVAHRDSSGAFGQLEALCEVRGIGMTLAERLRPLVTFTGPRRPLSAACGEASQRSRRARGVRSPQPR